MIVRLSIATRAQGLHEFTAEVHAAVQAARVDQGLCTLFIRHTSASLLIQENADATAKRDLESWLKKLVPEDERLYTHNDEGPDDMPAHIKAALTPTSLAVPISDGRLVLGQWQGIYLFEHRRRGGTREVVLHIAG